MSIAKNKINKPFLTNFTPVHLPVYLKNHLATFCAKTESAFFLLQQFFYLVFYIIHDILSKFNQFFIRDLSAIGGNLFFAIVLVGWLFNESTSSGFWGGDGWWCVFFIRERGVFIRFCVTG